MVNTKKERKNFTVTDDHFRFFDKGDYSAYITGNKMKFHYNGRKYVYELKYKHGNKVPVSISIIGNKCSVKFN